MEFLCKIFGHKLTGLGDILLCQRCESRFDFNAKKIEASKPIKSDLKPGILIRPTAEQLARKKNPIEVEASKETARVLSEIPELEEAKRRAEELKL